MMKRTVLLCVLILTAIAVRVAAQPATPEATLPAIEQLIPDVVSVRPHDTRSFTEGLFLDNGVLYESAGQYGASDVRTADPQTGKVLAQTKLDKAYFGEGIARVGDQLFQLTWREGTAFVYDAKTLKPLGTLPYNAEGWGLCYDGQYLWASDGSHTLTARDPRTLNALGQVPVTYDGLFIDQINELECVGDSIYANIWNTDNIVRIDKATGRVTARIDAGGLLTAEERAALPSGAVLNGIAYDPQHETFLVTGKLWPKLFEVKFVPAGQ
jgi:glutaminyl-peptide cyclotransferase